MRKLKANTRKESKDGQVEKLKSRVRRLKKDKDQMAEQIKQLRKQINEQQEYINKHVSDKTVNEVIQETKEKKINSKKIACISCESHDTIITVLSFGKLVKCINCKSINLIKR